MKPADFFIGSREFFGSLIPGLLWLIAIVLLLVNASIQNLLEFAVDANWIEPLSFIGLSLLIGTLLRHISFNFSRRVHKFLREAEQPHSRYPKISRFLNSRIVKRFIGESLAPMPYRTALLTKAERMINERLQDAYPNLKSSPSDPPDQLQDAYPRLEGVHFDPADRLYQGERQVFTACKRSVLARSQELGRALKEKEAEINLIGTLPLPVALLALGLLSHAGDISELMLRMKGQPCLWVTGIIVVAVTAFVHLLLRFHALRKEETRVCLETFFLLEYGLAESRKGDQPAAINGNEE